MLIVRISVPFYSANYSNAGDAMTYFRVVTRVSLFALKLVNVTFSHAEHPFFSPYVTGRDCIKTEEENTERNFWLQFFLFHTSGFTLSLGVLPYQQSRSPHTTLMTGIFFFIRNDHYCVFIQKNFRCSINMSGRKNSTV